MGLVECHDLTKQYGPRCAVDGLSIAVEEGEVFGLLGPNGAGKTTLFRLLLGLVKPTAGSATLFGRPAPPAPDVLSQVGAMVEEPAFYGWMNSRAQLQNSAMTGGLRLRRTQVSALLESVGLDDSDDRPVKRFSQGMRQRLGLARAIMRAPRLLILDEPANGLDPAGIVWLRSFLREQAASGVTVLVSSHQLGEVERVCDRVAIMDRGRVVEVGRTADVGGGSHRVHLVVSEKDVEAATPVLGQFGAEPSADGAFVVGDTQSKAVLEALAGRGIFPESVGPEATSLERRFLEITGRAH